MRGKKRFSLRRIAAKFFLLLIISGFAGALWGSEVSFTITGKLPETLLKAPRVLFRLELITIDPLEKRVFEIYPAYQRPIAMIGEEVSFAAELTLTHKKMRPIRFKEEVTIVIPFQKRVLFTIREIPDPRKAGKRFSDAPPLVVTPPARDMTQALSFVLPIEIFPSKRKMVAIEQGVKTLEQTQEIAFPFSAEIPNPKGKNTMEHPVSVRFGIDSTLDFLISLESNDLFFEKGFGQNYQAAVLLGDAVVRAEISGEDVSFLLEKDRFSFRPFINDGVFGLSAIQKEWPFKSMDTGIDFLYPYPLPHLVWYPGIERHFSLTLGADNGHSYGPGFKIYFEPLWLSVFSGISLPDTTFDITAKVGFTIKPIRTNLFAVLGYNQNPYGKVRLETQAFYMKPFHIRAIAEAGYDNDLYAASELEIQIWSLMMGAGLKWQEDGFVYFLTVGFKF